MGTLQKALVSATAILSFSFYSYFLRTQDTQLATRTPSLVSANTVQQNTAGGSAPPSSADVQAYIDRINAAAAKNLAAQKQAVLSRERESERGDDEEQRSQIVAVAPPQQTQASAPAPAPSQPAVQPAPTPAPTPAPAPKPAGQYKDGSYTGPSVNVFYGYVQVQAVIQGGQLADVVFLQYPSDRSTSRSINSQAMPLLTQEAIQAQSASVNGVSGASATSQGFVQSLTDALTQAHV
jgi:uncharacterized protein with FMN-binding domain